jgi:DNA-binding response OmpR family regulator
MAQTLVVDDDLIVRELVPLWLRTAGYTCDAVPDAKSAWNYVHRHNLRLMTLDVSMPGESGIELLTRLRREFPDLQVVMMTSMGDDSTAMEALSLGAFAYLTKPVEPDDLLAHVDRAMQRNRAACTHRQ